MFSEMPQKKKAKTAIRKATTSGKRNGGEKSNTVQYSEDQLRSAIEEFKTDNISIRDVAKKYGIPSTTLYCKARGVRPIERKMGPKPILGSFVEKRIVKCLFTLADAGFPLSKQQLLDNVADFASKQSENPFKNGRPGRKWFELFRSRHPSISMRVAQNISRARAGVTEENLRNWFEKTRKFCETNDCFEALTDPRRVYNLDETAFFLSPEVGKVMAKKGAKSVYNTIKNSDRQCTTVLMGGNAAGQMAPSMLVFKAKNIPKKISDHLPDNWGIGELNQINLSSFL